MDFLITPSGDLSFSEVKNESKRLTVNFYQGKDRSLRVNFDIETYEELLPQKNTLTITFDVYDIKENKRVLLVKDDAYISQQILMRLKTSLGELPLRQEIGSMMETVMHKDLMDSAIHRKVEKIVSEAIRDLIDDYSVKAIPSVSKIDGYNQCIKVYIYKDNSLLISYEMEW